jgi:hypothetical protein
MSRWGVFRSEYRVYAGQNPLSRLKPEAADKKSLTHLKAVLQAPTWAQGADRLSLAMVTHGW